MARLRYNNSFGALGADPGPTGNVLTFVEAPTWETLTGSDFIPLCLDAGQDSFEIVWVTAYIMGQLTCTVLRQAEDGADFPSVAHPNGTWACNATLLDFQAVSGGVSTFNGRTGAVIPAAGDYSADEVINAADLSDGSLQSFAGEIFAPTVASDLVSSQNLQATGDSITGITNVNLLGSYVGEPPAGTYPAKSVVFDVTGAIWATAAGGLNPSDWVELGSGGSVVSSFNTRTGAVTLSKADVIATGLTFSDVSATQAGTALPLAGGTLTGDLILFENPTSGLMAATKAYVDANATGLVIKAPSKITTVAGTPLSGLNGGYTYSNGTAGVGATLTAVSTGTLTIDGHLVAVNERVLLKDETSGNAPYNGIYLCTTAGASGVAYVLTRATDMNSTGLFAGAYTYVTAGTVNAGASFACATSGPTVGTTAIVINQFYAPPAFSAGTGITITGTSIAVTSSTYLGVSANLGDLGSTTTALANLGALPTAGGTMSGAIAMGSHKITGLTNGSSAQDAAAFGQIPTALPPNGSAGGDLAGTYPSPTLATGIVTAGSTSYPSAITVDAKGRVTAVGAQATPILSGATAGGDLAGTYPSPTLATGIVSAGTTNYPGAITVDAKGRVTSVGATSTPLLATASAGGDLTGNFPNPTLATSGVTAQAYAYPASVTFDAKGRATSATAGSAPLLISGGTLTGGLTLNADPTTNLGAATKQYVDNAVDGTDYKMECPLGTAAALPANTYSNGASGVGATLTGVGFGALVVDGTTVTVGQRILVKNEATAANNGIYTVTTVGAVATLYVLTRATDYNQASEIAPGDAVFVLSGTANSLTTWVMTQTAAITIGTTAINWAQIQGNAYTSLTGDVTASPGSNVTTIASTSKAGVTANLYMHATYR